LPRTISGSLRYQKLDGHTYDGTVANLDGLQHVQHQLGALAREHETLTGAGSMVNLVGEVDSLEGGGEVGNNTGQTESQSLLGDLVQAEGVLDNFLYSHFTVN